MSPIPDVEPFEGRWGLCAVFRQALHDLEQSGAQPALVVHDVRAALDAWVREHAKKPAAKKPRIPPPDPDAHERKTIGM